MNRQTRNRIIASLLILATLGLLSCSTLDKVLGGGRTITEPHEGTWVGFSEYTRWVPIYDDSGNPGPGAVAVQDTVISTLTLGHSGFSLEVFGPIVSSLFPITYGQDTLKVYSGRYSYTTDSLFLEFGDEDSVSESFGYQLNGDTLDLNFQSVVDDTDPEYIILAQSRVWGGIETPRGSPSPFIRER